MRFQCHCLFLLLLRLTRARGFTRSRLPPTHLASRSQGNAQEPRCKYFSCTSGSGGLRLLLCSRCFINFWFITIVWIFHHYKKLQLLQNVTSSAIHIFSYHLYLNLCSEMSMFQGKTFSVITNVNVTFNEVFLLLQHNLVQFHFRSLLEY